MCLLQGWPQQPADEGDFAMGSDAAVEELLYGPARYASRWHCTHLAHAVGHFTVSVLQQRLLMSITLTMSSCCAATRCRLQGCSL